MIPIPTNTLIYNHIPDDEHSVSLKEAKLIRRRGNGICNLFSIIEQYTIHTYYSKG